jgi:hypothetical protein
MAEVLIRPGYQMVFSFTSPLGGVMESHNNIGALFGADHASAFEFEATTGF